MSKQMYLLSDYYITEHKCEVTTSIQNIRNRQNVPILDFSPKNLTLYNMERNVWHDFGDCGYKWFV